MTAYLFDTRNVVASIAFWLCLALVVYAYVGYPVIVGLWAWLRPKPVRARHPSERVSPATVSVVLAAHNEERTIERRLKELAEQIARYGLIGEVIVVSDGSTDRTAEIARAMSQDDGLVSIRLIELTEKSGKAAALTAGCLAARYEFLALADARQTWSADALPCLLENFADPTVGAVSGELVIESEPGVMASVGLYWRFEKWLRRREARIHSTVGLTGAICAVRRRLFRPIPAGTLLDDVYWPLRVAMQGYRVVFDERARAFDRLPVRVAAEFRRKVRTLSGNFQLVARLPGSLLPWRNPVWFALVSHKLARLVVPWAVLLALGLAAVLGGWVYGSLLAIQLAALLVGVAGLVPGLAKRSRIASAAGGLLVLNAAAWCSFWVWITGRATLTWTKTVYHPPTPPRAPVEASLVGAGQ